MATTTPNDAYALTQIQTHTTTDNTNTNTKNNLNTIFKYCLDVLRDNEHLTGDKALRTLAHLLDLRLLEPQFGKTIDIDEFDYNSELGDNSLSEEHKTKLLSIVRFSKLAKENEDNIPTNMKYLWDIILAVHPKTKNIFIKGRGFDIKNKSTYIKLISKLNSFDFASIEADILGEAYEEVIQDVMIGKTLGQFFTPPKVKYMMVNLVNPQIKSDGTIETIFDPAMGTGGFLITCLRHLIKQSKTNNINLNWEFIRSYGLGGREAEPDTYQLAVSNMLISSGYMFNVLEQGDSIRNPIIKKYDIILANPPFGIKGLNYSDINHVLRNEYLPIKTDNAVSLFIQAIIYMLNISGRCAIVLPDGQDLFSKTNATLIAIRKFLLKTCDLKEIIYLPPGIFTYTSIKTCVFYFVKKLNGCDVLKLEIKEKDGKEKSRAYKFLDTHQTTSIKFYDYNPDNNIKILLVDVPIEKIVSNSYSLNYSEYITDENINEVYGDGVEVKTLGELFKLNGNGKTNSKDITNTGEYPFYKASCNNPSGTHNTFDFDGKEYLLIIKSGGSSSKPISTNYGIGKVFVVNGKCAANIAVFQLLPKTNDNFKYLSYYLKSIQNKIQGLAKYCTNNGNIDMKELMDIKIPIPSLERQHETVKYLDFIYEKANKTSYEKIYELNTLNAFTFSNQKIYGKYANNEIKTLGEICHIIKGAKKRSKDGTTSGLYPLYYCSILGYLYLNTFDYTGEGIIINKTNGTGKAMVYYGNNKYNVGETTLHFKSIIESIQTKYIYYYLFHNIKLIEKYFKGANQKSIVEDDLFKIKIPIPSLERQKEIVEYCEYNDMLIKQLEKEIENNKLQAQQFIVNIVKTNVNFNHLDNDIISENTHNTIDELNDKHNTSDDLNDLNEDNNTIDDLNKDNNDDEDNNDNEQ